MMNNAKIGAAVLGGYVLGRTKKAKLAIGLGSLLAGSRLRPGELGKTLAQSPFLGNVSEQVRKELLSAGRSAATTVLSAKAEHLADSLHERTTGLREKGEQVTGRSSEKSTGRSGGRERAADEGERASGHRTRARAGQDKAAASSHRTSRSGSASRTRETHEEQTHGKADSGRSTGGAHRTRGGRDG